MSEAMTFTSPRIAREMTKVFGKEAKAFAVTIKNKKVIGAFVRKIDNAHKGAAKSKLVFSG